MYSQLIENDKLEETPNILYSRGISYEQIKNWEKAEQDFKRSLNLNPNDPYVKNVSIPRINRFKSLYPELLK